MTLVPLTHLARLLALGCCLLPLLAVAQTLRIGTQYELNTLDPHFFAAFPPGTSHSYIYDRLVAMDDDLNMVPGLTVSWQPLDATTWEFKLREGVTFHDGSSFDAEDVVATFERIPNVPDSPNSFAKYVQGIESVETPDPYTLIINTSEPVPTLPRLLTNVLVIRAEDEDTTTGEFNDGQAIGTGPYKLAEWNRGESLIVERFEDYWGELPEWQTVEERVLANDQARTAALLSGDVDVINFVPVADMPRLREDEDFNLFQGPLGRIHYVHMDSNRDASPHVNGGEAPNPLKNPQVRKALSLAINREAIIDRLLLGTGEPAGQMLPSSFEGTSPNLEPDPYDLEQAKALLTEAGYPDGFSMTFHATNGRYPSDVEIAQAIAQMWSRLGLDVEVEALARTIFFPRATDFEFSIYTAQYGTPDALDMAISMLHSRDAERGLGNGNRARYANEEVDALIQRAMVELDADERAALLAEAYETAMADTAVIPLYYPAFVCAAREGLDVAIRANGRLTAMRVSSAASP